MKSLIQAVALAVVLAVPVASFAQAGSDQVGQSMSQDAQATQTAVSYDAARTGNGGYGAGSHGTWQAGRGTHTTVSSYSPPIYNAH
ncbi:MAG TPA: hypothetical protein VGM85_19110 [Paraburkholderia sp.]|jgi:ABC-type sulfate transport system substrate-binding protein